MELIASQVIFLEKKNDINTTITNLLHISFLNQ
jgi:hypothetical protein